MFKNISNTIGTLAILLLVFGSISSVIAGLVFGSASGDGGFMLFLIVTVGGIFTAWASSCLMYGFAELISHTQTTEQYLEALLRQKINSTHDICNNNINNTPAKIECICPKCGAHFQISTFTDDNNPITNTSNYMWKCPKCGTQLRLPTNKNK